MIDIPYYYPENSTNTTSITEMRVTANLDDNCFITPRLGTLLDLTQENWFTLTRAGRLETRLLRDGQHQEVGQMRNHLLRHRRTVDPGQ